MSDEELFEKLNELIKMSKFDDELHALAKKALWEEITKEVRDKLFHLILVYTNILVDENLIGKDSKTAMADRILSAIHSQVMDDVTKIFNYKEEFSNPLEGDHIGINFDD